MDYLHVEMTGLRGRHHPAIVNIKTTEEVQKMRPHLKMLCGNLLTYGMKYEQTGQGSPRCRIFEYEYESDSHILGSCPKFSEIRRKILKEFGEILQKSKNGLKLEDFSDCEKALTQLVLDPSSMNLETRVHLSDPILPELFNVSRDLCAALCKRILNLLNELKNKSKVIST